MKSDNASEYEKKEGISYICDVSGNFTFVDSTFAALLGYTSEELRSMNFIELIHVDSLESIFKMYEAYIKTHQMPELLTSKCLRKNETAIMLQWHSKIIEKEGKILGFSGYATLLTTLENGQENNFSDAQIKELTQKINTLDSGSKRTFKTIRNIILVCLSKGELSINEVAHLSGVNWKTVENHLTYLIGKKLVKENFSSKYVRLFGLTERGNQYLSNLKKEFFNVTTADEIREVDLF
jgi:PAS domain S-box-containing protein